MKFKGLIDASTENINNEMKTEYEKYRKSGIVMRFIESAGSLFQNKNTQKGIGTIGVVLALTGLSACNGELKPSAPIESPGEMPSQSNDIPIKVSPTPTVATPTPTEEIIELTIGQQWYFDYMKLKEIGQNDIYAIYQANLALKNGELQSLIESGEIKKEDVRGLEKDYEAIDKNLINIGDDFLTDSYGDRQLSTTEEMLAIFREDPITLYTNMDFFNRKINDILRNDYSFASVIPDKESRERVIYITNLFDNIEGKDVSELDQLLDIDKLSWKEGWYILGYIITERNVPKIIYNGEESDFFKDYFARTYFCRNTLPKVEKGFNEITTVPTYDYCSPQK